LEPVEGVADGVATARAGIRDEERRTGAEAERLLRVEQLLLRMVAGDARETRPMRAQQLAQKFLAEGHASRRRAEAEREAVRGGEAGHAQRLRHGGNEQARCAREALLGRKRRGQGAFAGTVAAIAGGVEERDIAEAVIAAEQALPRRAGVGAKRRDAAEACDDDARAIRFHARPPPVVMNASPVGSTQA
jgi:hypothetical protein